MKKFLIFFMVMFGMACGAMAEFYGDQLDRNSEQGKCVLKPLASDTQDNYAVYFKTAEKKVSSECTSFFDEVRSELKTLYDGGAVAYFVLVGSADQQGDKTGYDNAKLSKERFDYVKEKILPTNAKVETVGWAGGSVNAQEFKPNRTQNWEYRGVYIYPVWARATCDAELIQSIKENITKLEKAYSEYPKVDKLQKLLENYRAAAEICTDVPGKKLTAPESKRLSKLLVDSAVLIEKVNTEYDIGLTQIVYNTEISEYYYNLAKIRDTLKISEWRDAEGKFNTARLVSDSIAGVVLGTAGGLITSHLVKKNQLKQGFEDLNCSVGGQKVAGYGDEIRIGLR